MENNNNPQEVNQGHQNTYSQDPKVQYSYQQYNNPQGNHSSNYNQSYTYQQGTGNPNYYGQGQQQPFTPYPSHRPYDPNNEPMKIKDWLVTMLLMLIPIANIVLVFVWAFSSNVNKSKKTFFQASLIFTGIIIGLYIVLFIILFLFALSTNAYLY